MVLRKITIDNSVRYIPKNKKQIQPISGGGRPNARKQNKTKNYHKTKKWVASGFGILK